jgi:hypothetical protein
MPTETQDIVADRQYIDHNLPMLRVHHALREAGELADELGVDSTAVNLIVQRVVAILGEDTTRVGYLCNRCNTLCPFGGNQGRCPTHGKTSGGKKAKRDSFWSHSRPQDIEQYALGVGVRRRPPSRSAEELTWRQPEKGAGL